MKIHIASVHEGRTHLIVLFVTVFKRGKNSTCISPWKKKATKCDNCDYRSSQRATWIHMCHRFMKEKSQTNETLWLKGIAALKSVKRIHMSKTKTFVDF